MSDEPQTSGIGFIANLKQVPGFIWPLLLCIPLTVAYLYSGKDQTIQNMLVSSFSSFLTLLIPRATSGQNPSDQIAK